MEATEVAKIATSAWGITASGENLYGRHGSILGQDEIDRLVVEPHALALLNWLKAHHAPDNTFWIADGLTREHLRGWSRRELVTARRALIEAGYIRLIRNPSKYGPALYRWTKHLSSSQGEKGVS